MKTIRTVAMMRKSNTVAMMRASNHDPTPIKKNNRFHKKYSSTDDKTV